MIPAHLKATVIALALLILLPAGARTEDEDKLIVAAHYAPWFKDGGEGWAATVNGVAHYPAYTPTLGWYDSRDDPTLSQHIAWARSYGINTFMIEWPGIATEDFPASIEDVRLALPRQPRFRRDRLLLRLFHGGPRCGARVRMRWRRSASTPKPRATS